MLYFSFPDSSPVINTQADRHHNSQDNNQASRVVSSARKTPPVLVFMQIHLSDSLYCSFFVMLAEGCYHMTCKCGQGFCYLCAKPWKTCSCVHWDERHLEREARQRVEAGQRAAHAAALAPADYNRWGSGQRIIFQLI